MDPLSLTLTRVLMQLDKLLAGSSVSSSMTSPLSIGLVYYMVMLMPYLDILVSQMAAGTVISLRIA